MTIPSFETIQRWKLIEDWPHRPSVDAVITSMVDKGYSSQTMVRAVRFIGAFIECQNKRNGGAPERLNAADIDQFDGTIAETLELDVQPFVPSRLG